MNTIPNQDVTLLSEVASYYSEKLANFGATPSGVDWNGEESQILRFEQLCQIISTPGNFSINDLGCGYGSLFDYLADSFSEFSYTGIDVSNDMVEAAQGRCKNISNAQFIMASEPEQSAEFGVASGIFNVRLKHTDDEWKSYIESTLDTLDQKSSLGFSFNCLTSYSDADKMRDYLYYADPCALFDLCKKKYSRNVTLLHDYDLYEFTILVKKQ